MAVVQSFFDQQKAGEINAIINNNFKNVAKYIPVHFDTLTTVERLNLGEDWKTGGKLVFDIDQDMVYIWDEDTAEWAEKLLEAKDSLARGKVAELERESYVDVELNSDCELIFKNIKGEIVDRQLLTADKIQYDSVDTVRSKIMALIQKDTDIETKLDDFIADTNAIIGTTPLPTTAKTLTGAINEIHSELDSTTDKVDKILDGTTVVPKAQHAVNADKATNSEKLGGELPAFYAKQTDLDATNTNVATNTNEISNNRTDIQQLQTDLNSTNDTITANWNDYQTTKTIVMNNNTRIDSLESAISNLSGAIIPKGSVPTVDKDNPEKTLSQYIYDTYYPEDTLTYVGKAALTEGNENADLTQYMTDIGHTPVANDTVIDTNTNIPWTYNGTDWQNNSTIIESGWAVTDKETNNMWVYVADSAEWIIFGGGGGGSLNGVKLVDDEYTIELTSSQESYSTPTLQDYNKDTDVIKLFMNGAYMSKSNYTISVNDDNIATITNTNHTSSPWQVGWEIIVLVTRIIGSSDSTAGANFLNEKY